MLFRITSVLALALTLFSRASRGADETSRPSQSLAVKLPAFEPNSALRWLKMIGQDSVGFTDFPLGHGARIILISSSEGSDFNDGQLRPVKTLRKAMSLMNPHSPDRLLFKRGDVFSRASINANIGRGGASFLEPMVIGAYGDIRLPRPVLEGGISLGDKKNHPEFLAIQSLDFYAASRDPGRRGFDPNHPDKTQPTGINMFANGSCLWIEDCSFRYFGVGITLQSPGEGYKTVIIRRCLFADNYDPDHHSQGIYASGLDGVLIEDNVFDHNGYNERVPRANRTIFNHNIYVQHADPGDNLHYIVRGNISARASSHGCQLRPGGLLRNNLFLKNPLAAFVGYGASAVVYNVVLDADSIDKDHPRGQGLQVLNCDPVLVEGNIVAHKKDAINGMSALDYDPVNKEYGPLPSRGEFANNIVYDWAGPAFQTGSTPTSLFVHDNVLDENDVLMMLADLPKRFEFMRDDYRSDRPRPFSIAGKEMDEAQWSGITGEAPAQGKADFIDPARDIATYAASIGLADASLDGFLAAARQQRRGHWDKRLTAAAVNTYIRRGFMLKAGGAPWRPTTEP